MWTVVQSGFRPAFKVPILEKFQEIFLTDNLCASIVIISLPEYPVLLHFSIRLYCYYSAVFKCICIGGIINKHLRGICKACIVKLKTWGGWGRVGEGGKGLFKKSYSVHLTISKHY